MTMRKETDRFSNFFSFALILDFISFDKIFFSKKKKTKNDAISRLNIKIIKKLGLYIG